MRMLVLNSGSSSVKFRVLDFDHETSIYAVGCGRTRLRGVVKGIGSTATFELEVKGKSRTETTRMIYDHQQAVRWLFEQLKELNG
ncbi:MAG: hypothetical protein OEW26_07770, partial [Nitrospirota bacterium]|nr:hypothetical protein [Nitrospirota bacterium]